MSSTWRYSNKQKEKYNILIIGETGAGKSTLINYFTNFFHGGKLGQLRLSIPSKHYKATEKLEHSEADTKDTTKSQTCKCTEYEFTKNELLFGFIDTPGLSDTKGMQSDEKNILQIMSAAADKGTLAAIMIVINGTQSRATSSLCHTLNEMKNVVPDSFLDNIILVLTNCSNRFTANFNLSQLEPWKIVEENVFYMNNFALCNPKEMWLRDEGMKQYVQNGWNESMTSITQIINRLKQIGHQATTAFKEMHQKRDSIKSNINKILHDLELLQNLQNDLEEAQSTQKEVSEDAKRYSNYKQKREVEYTEFVKSEYYSRICFQCSKVCYEDWVKTSSLLGWYTASAFYAFYKSTSDSWHKTFGVDYCYKCKHSLSLHFDNDEKPVKKTKTVEEIIDQIKTAYDHHTQKEVKVKNKISSLQEDIAAINTALSVKEAAIQTCCEDLKKVCSQFNLVKELDSVIDVMQKKANGLRSTAARKSANKMIDNITQVMDKLKNN